LFVDANRRRGQASGMIRRTVEISRTPMHVALREGRVLLLRKGDAPPRPQPAHQANLAASIPVDDLGMLIVDEARTTYTHQALCALAAAGAVVVVCGAGQGVGVVGDHLPVGLLLPLSEHSEVVWRLDDQVSASAPLKKNLWKTIVVAKIAAQAAALALSGGEGLPAAGSLRAMAGLVRSGDAENHEAQAARVYWSAWLPPPAAGAAGDAAFRRTPGDAAAPPPNNLLDYGYAVLRAAVARALVGAGLLPTLGLKHRHRANTFCLADDLMEPLRPMVDLTARRLFLSGHPRLTQPVKAAFLHLLAAPVRDRTGEGPLMVVLHRYAASLAQSLAEKRDRLDPPRAVLERLTGERRDWAGPGGGEGGTDVGNAAGAEWPTPEGQPWT
jgi:CRISPR-associated protein Cas1